MRKKMKTWVFTLALDVYISADLDEAAARAALARRFTSGPNDLSQHAWLREWTMNDWYQFIVEFSDSLVRATLLHEADGLSLVYEKTGDFSASTAPAPIEWYQDGGDDGEIQIDYFRIE